MSLQVGRLGLRAELYEELTFHPAQCIQTHACRTELKGLFPPVFGKQVAAVFAVIVFCELNRCLRRMPQVQEYLSHPSSLSALF